MSAVTQNYVYSFGKKKPDAKEKVVSKERMAEVRKASNKYLKEKHEAKA